jgi:hypothetical protein
MPRRWLLYCCCLQATWAEETGDSKAAATIYSAVGQTVRAVHILGERGLYNQLIELVRTLPSAGGQQGGRDSSKDTDGGASAAEDGSDSSSALSSARAPDGNLPRDVKVRSLRCTVCLCQNVRAFSVCEDWACSEQLGAAFSIAFALSLQEALGAAGQYFRHADLPKFARECFVKLGDSRAMVQV